MSEEKVLTNLSIHAFWHREGKEVESLHSTVGVERVTDSEGGARVYFTIRPSGLEFLAGMREGHIELRYNSLSMSNPFSGKQLIVLSNIDPYHITLENLNPLEAPAYELVFKVRARCVLEWDLIQSPIQEKENVSTDDDSW